MWCNYSHNISILLLSLHFIKLRKWGKWEGKCLALSCSTIATPNSSQKAVYNSIIIAEYWDVLLLTLSFSEYQTHLQYKKRRKKEGKERKEERKRKKERKLPNPCGAIHDLHTSGVMWRIAWCHEAQTSWARGNVLYQCTSQNSGYYQGLQRPAFVVKSVGWWDAYSPQPLIYWISWLQRGKYLD